MGLLNKRFNNTRVTMTLIDRRVTTQKIEVTLALHIPDKGPFAPLQYHRQGVIVVGIVLVLQGDVLFSKGMFQRLHKAKINLSERMACRRPI